MLELLVSNVDEASRHLANIDVITNNSLHTCTKAVKYTLISRPAQKVPGAILSMSSLSSDCIYFSCAM